MSSMAKIFVVVNLVLGIVAFASAATLLGATDDYRKAYEEEVKKHQQDNQNNANEIKRLDLTAQQQTAKASTEAGKAAESQAKVDDLEGTLAKAEAANQTLRSSVESFAKQLEEQKQQIAANSAFLEKLNSENKAATQDMINAKSNLDKEVQNRVGLEQQVSELNEQVQTLQAAKGDLDRQLVEANFYLEAYRAKFGPLDPVKGAPGLVTVVKGNLVGISVGSNDKVRVGDLYSLSRGEKYVGRIKIVTVDRNQAVGEFQEGFEGTGAPPQAGDKASPGALQ
jgi:capsule polysaccharide export protein KpsE/RkpR